MEGQVKLRKRQCKPHVEIDIDECERLASRGLNLEQIANALGISRSTLYFKRQEPQVEQALKRGQARGIANIANKLYSAADNGEAYAICFYLKTVAGWREKAEVEGDHTVRIIREVVRSGPDSADQP